MPALLTPAAFYRHAPRPQLVISVNPQLVNRSIPRPVPPTFIAPGSWDQSRARFWDISVRMHVIRECLEAEASGVDFRDAARIRAWKDDVLRGNFQFDNYGNPIDTPGKVDDTVRHYMDIFKSIRSGGYDERLGSVLIGVAIARNGDLLKAADGRHRLAAVHLAGITSVKVMVKHVHEEFFKQCLREYSSWPFTALIRGVAEVERRHQRVITPEELADSSIPTPKHDW